MWTKFSYYWTIYNCKISKICMSKTKDKMWKNGVWILYVVLEAIVCLFEFTLHLSPSNAVPCWLTCVYHLCGFSHPLAFACVQPMNSMLESLGKKEESVVGIHSPNSLPADGCGWLCPFIKSPNFCRIAPSLEQSL